MKENLHYCNNVYGSRDIVEHDPGAFRKPFQLSNRKRLEDVEGSKKYKTGKKSFPRERNRNQGNELCDDLVDDYEVGVFSRAGARDTGGGGDRDEGDNDGESHYGGSARGRGQRMSEYRPEQHCRGRGPCSGAGAH